jgi:tRNA (guanine-N7-)-methyltransferase
MEIGFGNGEFLLDLAARHPQANILGVEISHPSLRKAARKTARAGLENVQLVHSGAMEVLWALMPVESLAAVYINFPDPWPKAAHHERRLINDRFLHLLATRTLPGARLDIATDHADYAEVIEHYLSQSPYFDSRLQRPFVTEDPERLVTKYEMIAREEGRISRYFKWQRNETSAPNHFPFPEEFEMPHVTLQSALTVAEIAQRFQPQTFAEGDVSVRFIGVYHSTEYNTLLVDTYIDEQPVTQRIGITVRSKEEQTMILRLHEIGFPRPTVGTHQAIHFLSHYVQTLDPEARIVQSNLSLRR